MTKARTREGTRKAAVPHNGDAKRAAAQRFDLILAAKLAKAPHDGESLGTTNAPLDQGSLFDKWHLSLTPHATNEGTYP